MLTDSVTIKTGSASITMKKDGTIAIKGKDITIQGTGKIGDQGLQRRRREGQQSRHQLIAGMTMRVVDDPFDVIRRGRRG